MSMRDDARAVNAFPWKSLAGLLIVTATILGGLWLAFRPGLEEEISTVNLANPAESAPSVGELSPQFTATTTTNHEISVPSAQGRPVWLIFNATWCSNCRAEMPEIESLYQEYGDQIDFISVFVGDSDGAVTEYATKLGLTFPQISDPQSQIGGLYRALVVPAHYFIAGDGKVAGLYVGALSEEGMRTRLLPLLEP